MCIRDRPDSAPPSDDTTSDLPELTEAEMFGDDSVSSDENNTAAPVDENANFEQDDEAKDDGDGDLPAEVDNAGDVYKRQPSLHQCYGDPQG